jgi:hypothetical protein
VNITIETRKVLAAYGKSAKNTHAKIQAYPQLLKLLASGNVPKCEIREVVALHHPVRWCVNPHLFVVVLLLSLWVFLFIKTFLWL